MTDQADTRPAAVEAIAAAVVAGDRAYLAAAARAGLSLPLDAAPVLAGLSGDGIVVSRADADDTIVVTLDPDLPDPADEDAPSRSIESKPTVYRAFVAALHQTRDGTDIPYPGRTADLGTVIDAARPAGDGQWKWLRGGLAALDRLGVLVVDETAQTVRPGPRLAAWDDPWVREDLPLLLSRLDPPATDD